MRSSRLEKPDEDTLRQQTGVVSMRLLDGLFPKKQNSKGERAVPGAVTRADLGLSQYCVPPGTDFTLQREFTENQLLVLRKGFKTSASGEWSWFMEGDTLYICLNRPNAIVYYRIDLSGETHCHKVKVAEHYKMSPEAEKSFLMGWFDCRIGPEHEIVKKPENQEQKPQKNTLEPSDPEREFAELKLEKNGVFWYRDYKYVLLKNNTVEVLYYRGNETVPCHGEYQ